MEVSDEQRQLAQQARVYGEQMQALSDISEGKNKVYMYIHICMKVHSECVLKYTMWMCVLYAIRYICIA